MSMNYGNISEDNLESKIMIKDAQKFWIFTLQKFEKYVFFDTPKGLMTYTMSGSKIDNLCLSKVQNIKQVHYAVNNQTL